MYSSGVSDDESLDCDEVEGECVTDLKGNRIVAVSKLATAIKKSMCCKKCAVAGHQQYMQDFLTFTDTHEEKVKKEEGEKWFRNMDERLKWRMSQQKTTRELYSIFCGYRSNQSMEDAVCKDFSVSKETYRLATSIFGLCSKKKNSHVFRIDADKISFANNFHANSRAKKYAINYKVVGAMQQMGCGATDITTLSAFLDLPT